VVVIILAAAVAAEEGPYAVLAAYAALAGLAILVWTEFIAPRIRRQRLKRPCDVRFVVRRRGHAKIDHLLQDDDDHVLDELVLPSHSLVEVEVGFIPRVPLYVQEIVFGCDGDADNKPFIVEALDRFTEVGQSAWKAGEGGHSRDIHKHWHVIRNKHYSVGSHRVITFRVQTGDAGVYRFQVGFFTDEVEGNAELKLRVEEKLQTRVPCRAKGHWGCFIGPPFP
jgi:hypothetical protein